MQIIPPLTLPSLGFGQLRKLVQPLLISHGCPASGATGPIQRWPGRGRIDLFPTGVQTVFVFQEGDGCFFDPRLRDGCAWSLGHHSGPWSH